MRKKYPYLFGSVVIALMLLTGRDTVSGQVLHGFWPDSGRYCLTVNSEFIMNSSGVSNEFIKAIYNSRYLDEKLKLRNQDRLRDVNNLFAFSFDNSISLSVPISGKNMGFYFGLESHHLTELRYPKNLFHLVFFGNGDLINEFVPLNRTAYTSRSFQQFKLGLIFNIKNKLSESRISVGAAINKGQKTLEFDIPEATFFTQYQGDFVALHMMVDMRRSDTIASDFLAFNGVGGSLDFVYSFRDKLNTVDVILEDLGFITWNEEAMHYSKDTLARFEGVDIPNLFSIDSTTLSEHGLDTNTNAFLYSKTKSGFTEMIPMRAAIYYSRSFFNNWLVLRAGLSYQHFSLSRPLLSFTPTVNIPVRKSLVSIAPTIIYGGYGGLNYGLAVSARIGKGFYFLIRSDYLNSLAFQRRYAGIGGMVSISKSF